MEGRMEGWMEEWKDGRRTDGWKDGRLAKAGQKEGRKEYTRGGRTIRRNEGRTEESTT